jgi:hypothetical protein
LDPRIVTIVPTGPCVGEKELIRGWLAVTWKAALLAPVPVGSVTLITPDTAPTGTEVVIFELESTVNDADTLSWNVTRVAPVKLDPVIVTTVPTDPDVGENEVMTGVAEASAATGNETEKSSTTATDRPRAAARRSGLVLSM